MEKVPAERAHDLKIKLVFSIVHDRETFFKFVGYISEVKNLHPNAEIEAEIRVE